ncbi:DDE-type integrase/transposase/recombinase [Streptomyces sp. NPDC007162]|uniref:DDE-type integrase/transposase/recombinase n=1 Tax=Streptomyces sp. NPDC007162 TaxID=3156917 RepID=UPI003402BFC2
MPGLKFVGDTTCLPTAEGWLYLATMIDLCTREVVGWSMADHMRTELVADAIRMAHTGGHTAGNAIFHPDRGPQGASHQFRALLGELDIRQSTGHTSSGFDNAAAESFFAVLKAEIGTTVGDPRTGSAGRVPVDRRTLQPGAHPLDHRLHQAVPGKDPLSPTAGPRRTKRKCRDPRGHFNHERRRDHPHRRRPRPPRLASVRPRRAGHGTRPAAGFTATGGQRRRTGIEAVRSSTLEPTWSVNSPGS